MGPAHRNVAAPLTGIGKIHLERGQLDEAALALERALEVHLGAEDRPVLIAEVSFALARALWARGERARAREFAGQAHAALLPQGACKQLEDVESWLAAHSG